MIPSCGEVTWFVSWNTGGGTFNEGLTAGVIIVGTPEEEPVEDVRISEGRIPRGMRLMADGTVQGAPEESGFFRFTVELTHRDGETTERDYTLEIE